MALKEYKGFCGVKLSFVGPISIGSSKGWAIDMSKEALTFDLCSSCFVGNESLNNLPLEEAKVEAFIFWLSATSALEFVNF